MKQLFNTLIVFFVMVLVCPVDAQEKEIAVGGAGSWMIPVGALSARFASAPGGSLFFFVNRGTPQWGGMFEYVRFSKVPGTLSINRPITDTLGGVPQNVFYRVPIPKLAMSLEAFGASAQARYNVLDIHPFKVHLGFGAGIYRWTFKRSEYYDTLKAQTPQGFRVAAILSVPALTQQDWSGAFNGGVDLSLRVADPLTLGVGAQYKIIVSELWPTLALDLENVSTLQMMDLRASLSLDF